MHAEMELSGSAPPEHFQTICVEYLGAANHNGIDHGPSFSYEKGPPCGGRFSDWQAAGESNPHPRFWRPMLYR